MLWKLVCAYVHHHSDTSAIRLPSTSLDAFLRNTVPWICNDSLDIKGMTCSSNGGGVNV